MRNYSVCMTRSFNTALGLYLHEFTNNEREVSIPREAAECGIENFEFIISELVQVKAECGIETSRSLLVNSCR